MPGFIQWHKYTKEIQIDPWTKNWFLVPSPVPVIIILVIYLYFCTHAGPKYMKDRRPYELRNLMIVYNFLQTALSIYLFYEALMSGWLSDYNLFCQPVDYSDNPKAMRMRKAVYLYFICKLVELLDTVFFVLRKKNRQISTLHLVHHTLMPVASWIGIRFVSNGHGTLIGLLNCFVHIIMYAYYMLSSIGPHMNKYLWWKKHLTTLQLVQFMILLVHSVQVFFNGCNFPKIFSCLILLFSVTFIYMFGSFYVENYITRAKQRSTKEGKNTIRKNSSDTIEDKVK